MNSFVSNFFDIPLFDPPLFEKPVSEKQQRPAKTIRNINARHTEHSAFEEVKPVATNPATAAMAKIQADEQVQSAIARSAAISSGKITEIILQDQDEYDLQLLLPLLAQLSQDNRWFAWVAPPSKMPKEWLIEAGIDINKIIVLKPDADHNTLDLATKALRTGTCHAVISWPGTLKDTQLTQLQTAAKLGNSNAILVRPR